MEDRMERTGTEICPRCMNAKNTYHIRKLHDDEVLVIEVTTDHEDDIEWVNAQLCKANLKEINHLIYGNGLKATIVKRKNLKVKCLS